MRRTGRVIFILILLVGSIVGMWLFQGWRMEKKKQTTQKISNVYITGLKEMELYGIDREKKSWALASTVTEQVKSGVADLILEENRVVKIICKPDKLQGKVLKIDDGFIQVEEYGKVALDDNFRLFHVSASGDVSVGKKEDLSVGYTDIQYVVAGGKICAALLGESQMANIRVLLSKGADSNYDMPEVVVSATSECEVTADGKTAVHPAGKKLAFQAKDVQNRVVIDTKGKGKIRLENIKRQYGVPEYRGIIEIEKVDKSLHIINEVNVEEYLYSVVPSEMPTEYPKEALKAQAICARSYAVQQMRGKRLAKYGAHVDDSVSFQVYNNLKEDEKSIQAVKETNNLIVSKNGKVVTTYFYSVSGGCSEGVKDVWFAKKDKSYLPVKWQGEQARQMDLSEEKAFAEFIKKAEACYDSSSPWYRWQTSQSVKAVGEQISSRLQKRYQVNPTQIQTKQGDGTYSSTGEVEIGALKEMKIIQRGQGGVARILEVEGSKHTVRIYTEYNIRYLLGNEKAIYKRKDKKEVAGLQLLPSGFFQFEKKGNMYYFTGGGYGHGVGMSQFGAKIMAEQGKNCEAILTFYFAGTTVASREIAEAKKAG